MAWQTGPWGQTSVSDELEVYLDKPQTIFPSQGVALVELALIRWGDRVEVPGNHFVFR